MRPFKISTGTPSDAVSSVDRAITGSVNPYGGIRMTDFSLRMLALSSHWWVPRPSRPRHSSTRDYREPRIPIRMSLAVIRTSSGSEPAGLMSVEVLRNACGDRSYFSHQWIFSVYRLLQYVRVVFFCQLSVLDALEVSLRTRTKLDRPRRVENLEQAVWHVFVVSYLKLPAII